MTVVLRILTLICAIQLLHSLYILLLTANSGGGERRIFCPRARNAHSPLLLRTIALVMSGWQRDLKQFSSACSQVDYDIRIITFFAKNCYCKWFLQPFSRKLHISSWWSIKTSTSYFWLFRVGPAQSFHIRIWMEIDAYTESSSRARTEHFVRKFCYYIQK